MSASLPGAPGAYSDVRAAAGRLASEPVRTGDRLETSRGDPLAGPAAHRATPRENHDGASSAPKVRMIGAEPVLNHLLVSMSDEAFESLRPHLVRVKLEAGAVLVRPHQPIEHVHFFESGLGTMIARPDTPDQMEICMIGRDGLAGFETVQGLDTSPQKTAVRLGGEALRLDADRLRAIMAQVPALQRELLRFVAGVMQQMTDSIVVCWKHGVHERLARWLLLCHERLDRDEIVVTHEALALTLGARRPGVTRALHFLEGEHAVRSRRGRAIIVSRDRLIELAGGAYVASEPDRRRTPCTRNVSAATGGTRLS